MTLRKILALTCLLLPMMASAHQFETGQRVPPIGITDRGELVLDKDQFSYKTWNSAQLVGKVRVLQHIAGRTSAKEKNAGRCGCSSGCISQVIGAFSGIRLWAWCTHPARHPAVVFHMVLCMFSRIAFLHLLRVPCGTG